jgi:serine/threonine protein kinase
MGVLTSPALRRRRRGRLYSAHLPPETRVSALKVCPTCSIEYPETERFCPKDGTALHWQSGASTDLVGSVIAERYHVLRRLGAGGMGRVYLAEHVKMGRPCAIKVLHPAMAGDAEAIGRFNREAANASRIEHPNVAAIYDFGETHDGLLYLAMQYIEGRTLTDIMKTDGTLSPLRVSDIVRQAAEGLHAAHAMNIVHRDLKPDNIMVSADTDGGDLVKVVDFGIAKSTGDVAQGVTRTGVVVGTVEYMSPEQISGGEVDGRSDQYALALVAFNLLTGDLPYPVSSTASTMVARLTEPPRSLSQIRPDVAWPNELEHVLSRSLERDASRRFPSVRDFAGAFHGAIAMMPSATSPTTRQAPMENVASDAPTEKLSRAPTRAHVSAPSTVRAPLPRRPRRALTIGAGVTALLLVAMASRGAVRSARASRAMREGIAAYRDGQRQVARDRLLDAARLAPNDPMPHVYLSRVAREGSELSTASREAIEAVRIAPNSGPALRELATTLFAMENYNGARAFYARAIAADTADHTSQGYLGCSLIQLGRVEEGTRWIRRAGSGTWSTCASSRPEAETAR